MLINMIKVVSNNKLNKKSSHPWQETAKIPVEFCPTGYPEGADPHPVSTMAGFLIIGNQNE